MACGSSRGAAYVMDCVNYNELMCVLVCNIFYGVYGILNVGDEYCVWVFKYFSDGTFVIGDSDGAVTFWDGKFFIELV